ncbi:MAG: hypothetical protein ACK5EO_01985 [Planctomycetota bacterium]
MRRNTVNALNALNAVNAAKSPQLSGGGLDKIDLLTRLSGRHTPSGLDALRSLHSALGLWGRDLNWTAIG